MQPRITVEPTTDDAYIKSVFLSPSIYAQMSDDASPAPEMLRIEAIKSIPCFFLRPLLDGVPAGVWWLIWKGDRLEGHTALLPNCRGRAAIMATRMALDWIWKNTRAASVTSYAWSDSTAVAWFCRACGLALDRTEPWPNTRGGKKVDITYFTINRPEGA